MRACVKLGLPLGPGVVAGTGCTVFAQYVRPVLSKIKIVQYTFQPLSYTYTYVLSRFFSYKRAETSSTENFVAATHPSLAVISVGLSSIFGHPHNEVVERWRTSGAQILTTGRSGTITVSTDGHDLKVETFIKKQ